jgi:hypothetical protein
LREHAERGGQETRWENYGFRVVEAGYFTMLRRLGNLFAIGDPEKEQG